MIVPAMDNVPITHTLAVYDSKCNDMLRLHTCKLLIHSSLEFNASESQDALFVTPFAIAYTLYDEDDSMSDNAINRSDWEDKATKQEERIECDNVVALLCMQFNYHLLGGDHTEFNNPYAP